MTEIVRTEGLVKRYDGTLAVAGVDLSVDGRRDLRPRRTQRRRQDDDAAHPGHPAPAVERRRPRSPASPSPGTPTRSGASSASCRTSFGVYDDMKVWEYLDFFARCYGIPAARRRRMIGDLLELVDLGDKRDAYVQTLSRGMQQRLCLAHALVHDPEVLLLDEPASGLDPRARVELRELLRELRTLGQDDPHQQPHPSRARGAVHERRDRRPRPGARAGPGQRHRATAALRGRAADPGPAATARRSRPRESASRPILDVASATVLEDGTIELGFRGDDAATARLLAETVGGRPRRRQLRPRRQRPRGAVPPGDRAGPRTHGSGVRTRR